MSQAATIRVGREFGRANLAGAARSGYVSAATGLVTMLVIAACLLLFADRIIGLFIDLNDPQNIPVLNLAIGMMTIAAISQILNGPQRIIVGALYGLQDTWVPMLLSLITLWGVGLISGYWLGLHTALAGNGLWLGSAIGIALSGGVYLWRFQRLTSLNRHRNRRG
jgi:multidrug resistance protein, MATE family